MRGRAFARAALDDALDVTRGTVALALDDLPRENDVLEVEDGEVVVFKFVSGVGRYNVVERFESAGVHSRMTQAS